MSYVQYAGSASSYVYFTMPSASVVTVQFDYWAPSSSFTGTLFDTNASNTWWRGAISRLDVSSARTFNLFVNGTATGTINRGAMYTLLHNSTWATCRYTDWSASVAEPSPAQHATNARIVFGAYVSSSGFSAVCRCRNFKVKLGTQANVNDWDFQSELGNNNGFTQQNVTVVLLGRGTLVNSNRLINSNLLVRAGW